MVQPQGADHRIQNVTMENSMHLIWVLSGLALISIEVLMVPGIGFLFAGLGAISVGVALMGGLFISVTAQVTWFFCLTAIWAAVLWWPLKRAYRRPDSGYSDMVGDIAIVGPDGLQKRELGEVRWSGAIMNCRLNEGCDQEKLNPGTEVKILKVSDGILIVEPTTKD